MIMAAAKALVGLSPTRKDKTASLLPPLSQSREVSRIVAEAVGKQALADGLAAVQDEAAFCEHLEAGIWEPVYADYQREV
jgi:malate dehydrogenase (oxaloacetate-decarboxylating)